ncbi:MAG: hypothetical protein ACK5JD_07295 [Mangrovibacterium sp.]
MKRIPQPSNTSRQVVNLAEFTFQFRLVHQLAVLKCRNQQEEELFRNGLKQSTRLLQHIHPGMDKQIDKLIDFSFRYYMEKKEEALLGNLLAKRIVSDLHPLFCKEILSLVPVN